MQADRCGVHCLWASHFKNVGQVVLVLGYVVMIPTYYEMD